MISGKMEGRGHPSDPRSNIATFDAYDPKNYAIDRVSQTVLTDESLTPGRPPCLTQRTIGMFLQPLTRELTEVPQSPTVAELPDAVIDRMVLREKAFWVDKPGVNAYELTDAFYKYKMTSEMVKPPHQDVFPRSYQYDLDCVSYRRRRACDGLKQVKGQKKHPLSAHCRDCGKLHIPGLTPFQLAWAQDPGQKRWKYYPDLTVNFTLEQTRELMKEMGRPFQNEACTWYNKNYPSVKYDMILRKFSK